MIHQIFSTIMACVGFIGGMVMWADSTERRYGGVWSFFIIYVLCLVIGLVK